MIGEDDQLRTAGQCQVYESPIRVWLARTHPGDALRDIWFSRPEVLVWKPTAPRCGQDVVVEGGVLLCSSRAYRLRLELHAAFCNCAWCRDEDSVADCGDWVDIGVPTGGAAFAT